MSPIYKAWHATIGFSAVIWWLQPAFKIVLHCFTWNTQICKHLRCRSVVFSPDTWDSAGYNSNQLIRDWLIQKKCNYLARQKTTAHLTPKTRTEKHWCNSQVCGKTVPFHILVLQSLELCTVENQISLKSMVKMLNKGININSTACIVSLTHSLISISCCYYL